MSIDPNVSVIVPAYNAEDYISDAILSVRKQTYDNWELLIVDDGSADRTNEIVNKYLDDPRIKYFYQENEGQGSARNLGVKMSKGFYLAFLDADDLWKANKLESQLEIFSKEDVSLVFSGLRCIDDNDKYLNKDLGSGVGRYQGFQALFLLAAGTITIPNSSVIATKESVLRVGGFNQNEEVRNMEDYDLWFGMLMSGYKFYGVKEVLGSYRVHQDQSTYADAGQSLKMINHLEKLSKKYPEKRNYFEFLILHRLSSYYKLRGKTSEARDRCLDIYFSNSCIHSYGFEKYLIEVVNFENYLKFKGLLIRRFRKFKTFVQSISD